MDLVYAYYIWDIKDYMFVLQSHNTMVLELFITINSPQKPKFVSGWSLSVGHNIEP